MAQQIDLKKIDGKIQAMKKAAQELDQLGAQFPALSKNTARIMASLKMLEINVSDLVDLQDS